MAKSFNESVAVVKEFSQGRSTIWRGKLNSEFNVTKAPNGGYMVAVMVRALREHQREREAEDSNQDCLSIDCAFINSGVPDEDCTVEVSMVKQGKTLTILNAVMKQKDKIAITGLCMFGKYVGKNLDENASFIHSIPLNASLNDEKIGLLPPFDDPAVRDPLEFAPKGEQPRSIFSRFKWKMTNKDKQTFFRMISVFDLEGDCPTMYRTYVQHEFPDEDNITVESMSCIVDANIPTVKSRLEYGSSGWVPTLTLSIQFYKEPTNLKTALAVYRLHSYGSARTVEETDLYDPETKELICCSRQHAIFQGIVIPKSHL